VQPEDRQAPPGWYPDPGGSAQQRYWDGQGWTGLLRDAAPETPGGAQQRRQKQSTSGWAIASLVAGILGVFVLAIPFALLARRRIAASGGRLGGDGLAIAGVTLGTIWLALAGTIAALALTGDLSRRNRNDFSGEQARIALTVDRVEAALAHNDGATACDALFTAAFARRIAAAGGVGCADFVRDAVPNGARQVHIDVRAIRLAGDRATVEVDEGGEPQTWDMLRGDGRWRVDRIAR
jgi:hypothetical protein